MQCIYTLPQMIQTKNINLLTSKRVIELLNKKQADSTGISEQLGHKSSTTIENLINSLRIPLGCIIKL